MAINLRALNENQLIELIRKAEQRKVEVEKENLTKVRNKIHALLELEGLTLKDLFGQPGKARRSTSAKNRNSALPASRRFGRTKRPK